MKMKKLLITGLVVSLIASMGISSFAGSKTIQKGNMKGNHTEGKQQIQTKKAELDSLLNALVKDGTITSDQLDKLKTYMEKYKPIKNGKPDLEPTATGKDPLSMMVTDGVLTQSQADAIGKVLHPPHLERGNPSDKLGVLVTNGTITSSQLETIKTYFEKCKPAKDLETSTTITKKDPLAMLVADNVITQVQSDAISKVLPQKHDQKRP